jgi:hypothetical protein
MRSVFWPECIFILFTTHTLLPIKEAQCVYVLQSSLKKKLPSNNSYQLVIEEQNRQRHQHQ